MSRAHDRSDDEPTIALTEEDQAEMARRANAPFPLGPPKAPLADSPWALGTPPVQGASIGELAALLGSSAPATPPTAPPAWSVPVSPAQADPATRPARDEASEVYDLVWFDPPSVARIRAKPTWRSILDALGDRPRDADLDDPALAPTPAALEDRREVFEVLVRGEPIDPAGVIEALSGAVREDGKLVAPLVLLVGDIDFAFDEIETLKAAVATATPLAAGIEGLPGTLDVARSLLATPDLTCPPAVAESLTARIRECLQQGMRASPASYLDAQTARVLAERRRYKRRAVFGGDHVVAHCAAPRGATPVPVYIPDAAASKLPLSTRFRARMIAEVHLGVDPNEPSPAALRALALARAAPLPRRG